MKRFLKSLTLIIITLTILSLNFSCEKKSSVDNVLDYDLAEPSYDESAAPRPAFTDAEISEQKEKGEKLMEDIIAAAEDLSKTSFTIPEGNYGFKAEKTYNGIKSGAVLKDIVRPDDNPFTIFAENVTFWFETLGTPCSGVVRSLHLMNCENIKIVGLTLDTYTADSFEAKVTEIDYDNNRIKVSPHNGTLSLSGSTLNKAINGSQFRIVPIKSTGEAIASYYNVNNGWGPESLWLKDIVEDNGEYWLYFKTTGLFDNTNTDEWKNTYGSEGTLEVGDHVCLVYGMQMTTLDNCKNIVMEKINCYIAKGGIWENGGYGNHTWKDCNFIPRPGTNQIFGGGDGMSQGLRHGSTYDGCTFGFCVDDPINIHGYWGTVDKKVNKNLFVNGISCSIEEGDTIEAYSKFGVLVATMTVAKVGTRAYNYNGKLPDGTMITMTEKVPDSVLTDGVILRVPSCECDGWSIVNCTFKNTYQRLLVASGSGIIDNCRFYNQGSRIEIANSTETDVYGEGGFIGDVTVSNNLFYNTANHPGATVISCENTHGFKSTATGGQLTICDNVFVSCGRAFSAVRFSNVSITGNIILNTISPKFDVSSFDDQITGLSDNGEENISNNKYYVTSCKTNNEENPTVLISNDLMNKIIRFSRLSVMSAKTANIEIRAALSE